MRLETDLFEQVNEVKRRLEVRFEDEKRHIEEQKRAEIEAIEKRYKDLIRTLEEENADYKKIRFNKEESETKMEGYKLEVKVIFYGN